MSKNRKKDGDVDLSIIPDKDKKPPTEVDRIELAIYSVFEDNKLEDIPVPYCTTAGKVMAKLSPSLREKVKTSNMHVQFIKHNLQLQHAFVVKVMINPNNTVRKRKTHIIMPREKQV